MFTEVLAGPSGEVCYVGCSGSAGWRAALQSLRSRVRVLRPARGSTRSPLPLFLPGASSGWSQAALDCGGLVTFASLLSLDAFLRKICVGLQGTAPPQRGCQCLPPVTRHWGLAWPEAYPAKAASSELPALFFSAALGTNLLDLLHQPPNDGGCKSRLWQL